MCLSQEPVNIRNQPKTGASTMSKNICSTCKHYSTIIGEIEPCGDCTLYPTWQVVLEAHYCGQWTTGNKDKPTALDNIDWNLVPEGYDWVAQDSNGDIYAWATEPALHNGNDGLWKWRGAKGTEHYIGHAPLFLPRFRNNLTKRPGT